MASASDADIYRYAADNRQIIVSKDEDFFYLARRPNSDAKLLWVRLGNCRTAILLGAFRQQWGEIVRCFDSGDRIVELR